ncbi:TonB-dependent receptor [Winogradskyella vincentii]|uniref:Carboxypeptidase-like regulatory domain-containing protein n=1 Tax=Winogradskyella vincentii TaxID=2877122 RepID=A0ABS7Y3B9_9FLAO|nr:TonB-dependent receptor [Winogradskyella vincentii]MCA0154433.1 carboxypeptidase-like regulatory domain-containing protein [Winogradskyella vincentii]
MRLNKLLFIILTCCLNLIIHAQNNRSVLLVDYVKEIEQAFDVKFSYSVNEVSTVEIERPINVTELKAIINYLNDNTLLKFSFINERYITISTLNKTISICGLVITKDEDLPLMGATASISNTNIGAITSSDGLFYLSHIPVDAIVNISYLGYETKSLGVTALRGESNCQNIILNPKEQQLNEILITKFLTTGLQKRRDGSTQLNSAKFGILPGLTEPDILQSIQALPGVESIDESISNINVRGGTNDQNLMLWNNIKMYHTGHFFGLISAYNPYLTDEVVVAKNGTSSEFSDGVSSTVNMNSKHEVSTKINGGVGANLLHADGYIEMPVNDKLGIQLSARRSYTDYFTTPTYDNYFNRSFQDSEITTNSDNINESDRDSEFYFYDYSAQILYQINPKHRIKTNLIGINNNLNYHESFTDSDNNVQSKTSSLKQQNLGFGGEWDAKWSQKFSTNLSSYYSKYNVDAVDFRIETDQKLTQSNEVLETGIKLNTNYKISDKLKLLNGYQFTEVGILNETTVSAPSLTRTKKDVLLNHALFSELEYSSNTTYLRLGVRGNYFEKFDKLIIEPRLNFRRQLLKRLALKIQGEFKNQSATQVIDFQDDFLGVENRRWILANNETIPISESKQASMGLEYDKNNLLIDIEGFYKTVDGITVSNQGFYNNFQFLNAIGGYEVKGLEFLANKTGNYYSVWVSYTYSINDYEFNSLTPSFFPNNVDIRHSVAGAVNLDVLDNVKVSLGGMYRSGRPFTRPVEGNETLQDGNNTFVNYDSPNAENLDYFMRLDGSLSYRFNISNNVNTILRVGVINILDRKNTINKYYEVDPNDANNAIEIENKSLGLTPNISWRLQF